VVVLGEDTLVDGNEVGLGKVVLGTLETIAAVVDNVKEWRVDSVE
jgi:hypothetical protein